MRKTIAIYALKFTAVILAMASIVAAAGAALSVPVGLLSDVGSGKPDDSLLEFAPLAQRSYIYAADGSLMATLTGEENRQPIALQDIPKHVIDAVLAVEDAGFFVHDGVNARGMLRAFQANVDAGGISQGGSTITQQVVKLDLLNNSQQTIDRKSQEIVLALRLERQQSKRWILERYMNTVYFGNHAYGIQSAAETYFGKSAPDLSIDQAAMLAGMIRNPNVYNPIKHPERVKERRQTALNRMVAVGVLDKGQAGMYAETPVPTSVHQTLPAPDDYFVAEVRRQLLSDAKIGATAAEREARVFGGGLRVYTTFDPVAQQQAVAARNGRLPLTDGQFPAGTDPETGQPRYGSGALISIEPATGAIRTMVGGPGFKHYQYNITTQGGRNPGSSFKPFVLATLMSQGKSPEDIADGRGPCTFAQPAGQPPYEVKNFDNSPGAPGTIRELTLRSSNCGYVRLGHIAGLQNVVPMAQKLGVRSDISGAENNTSTPLGTVGVTPEDMASAYATFANDGVYNPPYMIDKVVDRHGAVITQHTPRPTRVLDEQSARLVTSVLADNVRAGTGKSAADRNGHPMAGKTGTTQESTNGWFVGYSMDLATAVWVGGLGGQFEIVLGGRGITGGSYPAQIFGDFMTAYHANRPARAFLAPAGRPGGALLGTEPGFDLTPPPPPPPAPAPVPPPPGQPPVPTPGPTIPGLPTPVPITFPPPR